MGCPGSLVKRARFFWLIRRPVMKSESFVRARQPHFGAWYLRVFMGELFVQLASGLKTLKGFRNLAASKLYGAEKKVHKGDIELDCQAIGPAWGNCLKKSSSSCKLRRCLAQLLFSPENVSNAAMTRC